jgi:hypothetical protein
MSRYRWIDDRKAEGHEAQAACRVAGVSPSAYYGFSAGRAKRPSDAEWDEAILVNEIWPSPRQPDTWLCGKELTACVA